MPRASVWCVPSLALVPIHHNSLRATTMGRAQASCHSPAMCVNPLPSSPRTTPTSLSRLREMPASSPRHALLLWGSRSVAVVVMLPLAQLMFDDGKAHFVGGLRVPGTGCVSAVPLSPPNSPEGASSSRPHERWWHWALGRLSAGPRPFGHSAVSGRAGFEPRLSASTPPCCTKPIVTFRTCSARSWAAWGQGSCLHLGFSSTWHTAFFFFNEWMDGWIGRAGEHV